MSTTRYVKGCHIFLSVNCSQKQSFLEIMETSSNNNNNKCRVV